MGSGILLPRGTRLLPCVAILVVLRIVYTCSFEKAVGRSNDTPKRIEVCPAFCQASPNIAAAYTDATPGLKYGLTTRRILFGVPAVGPHPGQKPRTRPQASRSEVCLWPACSTPARHFQGA